MRKKRENWSDDELAILKKYYEALGATGVMLMLPRHSYGSISKKAQSLKIKCDVTTQRITLGLKKLHLPKYLMTTKNGYVIYTPTGKKKDRVLYHRYLMEQHLGRKLSADEIVHHIDGDKHHNIIENLEITNRKDHIEIHRQELHPQK